MAHARFQRKREKVTWFFAALLLCAGCATVDVPKVGDAGYHVEDDEQRLMNRADEAVELLDDSSLIYPDVQLQAYLNELAQKLALAQIPDGSLKVTVKVIEDPTLNAFALPNGRIYVHTGILAAAQNEAQVATLLGHEMTHIAHRHILKQFRSIENKTAFWGVFGMPLGIATGGIGGLVAQLSLISSVSGYSQSAELEADEEGFKAMRALGYDARESKKLFERLDEFNKDEEIKVPYFFSSHPRTKERIQNFEELIGKNPQENSGIVDGGFPGLVRPILLDNARACLEKGYFKTAQRNIESLIRDYPADARGHALKGRLFRERQDHAKKDKKRDKASDYPEALKAYDEAIRLDPQAADSFKERGRLLFQMGEKARAKEDFLKYFQLKPDASDKAYIKQLVDQS